MSTEAEYKPGLEDVPAAKSAVSFLDGKKARLEYRGIPVEALAKESCFEEIVLAAHQGRPADAEATRRLRPRPAAAAGDPLPAEGPDQVHARRRAPDGRAARVGRGARHVLPVPDGRRPGQELGRDAAA